MWDKRRRMREDEVGIPGWDQFTQIPAGGYILFSGTICSLWKVLSRQIKWSDLYFKKIAWCVENILKGAKEKRRYRRCRNFFNRPGVKAEDSEKWEDLRYNLRGNWIWWALCMENWGEKRIRNEQWFVATWFPKMWKFGEEIYVRGIKSSVWTD